MKEQLKKGDRCQFQHLIVTVEGFQFDGRWIEICHDPKTGGTMYVTAEELTRITTHAERMQKVIAAAFDAENRLDDDEAIIMLVGDMAEFVRYHCKLRDELDTLREFFHSHSKGFTLVSEKIEKLLKGEA